MSKKLLILIGLFILVLVIFFISRMAQSKISPDPSLPLTPTQGTSQNFPTTSPNLEATIDPFPTFTGDNGVGMEVEEYVNVRFQLMNATPIETDTFELDFDYSQTVFIVTLKEPKAVNRQVFSQWLTDNGYASIPQDQFIYQ